MYIVLLRLILIVFKLFMETLYLPIRAVRLFKKYEKCPPITDDVLLLRASELSERIRKKEISSTNVVQAYIKRINEVNVTINAVIENRFQLALEEARKADNLVESLTEEEVKGRYPLLGIPITIKGSIAVKGLQHTAGRVDIERIADEDAVVVQHCRNAGAIPLLISNVPEVCLNWETSNQLIGYTFNPYNTSRTSGGSSGGEVGFPVTASLIGSGASLIGIGSDLAGSLRWPAHCCGVWGHKPSPGVVSCVGHYPDCRNKDEWNKIFTLGPIARYAADLKLLLKVIAEPNMKDVLELDKTVNLEKIHVHYVTNVMSPLIDRADEDVLQAMGKVVSHFDVVCDKKCAEVDPDLMKNCSEVSFLRLLHLDGVEHVFNETGDGSYEEMCRYLGLQSEHEFTTICYGILRKNIRKLPEKYMVKVYKYIDKLRRKFLDFLGDDGVFILPTYSSEAHYKGDIFRKAFNCGYLAIFNVLGFPVTNCPIMFSRNGLPIGIQVVAAPNMDRLTLNVAEDLERAFGGWKFA